MPLAEKKTKFMFLFDQWNQRGCFFFFAVNLFVYLVYIKQMIESLVTEIID